MRPPTRRRRAPMPLEMDPVEAAGAFALLGGALALLLPYFLGLTLALAGLLLALAALREGRRGPPPAPARGSGARRPLPFALALAGWAALPLLPEALAPWRGLTVALAAFPLWWRFRHRVPFGGV